MNTVFKKQSQRFGGTFFLIINMTNNVQCVRISKEIKYYIYRTQAYIYIQETICIDVYFCIYVKKSSFTYGVKCVYLYINSYTNKNIYVEKLSIKRDNIKWFFCLFFFTSFYFCMLTLTEANSLCCQKQKLNSLNSFDLTRRDQSACSYVFCIICAEVGTRLGPLWRCINAHFRFIFTW